MLIGGYDSSDFTDPIAWKEWIMEYKGWSADQWDQFYTDWTAPKANKQAIMNATGVHIFDWSQCNCGSDEKSSARNATIDWGMPELERQMGQMVDITVVAHSKGGNLLFNYISNPHGPYIENAIIIASPITAGPIVGISKSKVALPVLNEYSSEANVVVLNNYYDVITRAMWGDPILGATNRMDYSLSVSPGTNHAFHRTTEWAQNTFRGLVDIRQDARARTGIYEYQP